MVCELITSLPVFAVISSRLVFCQGNHGLDAPVDVFANKYVQFIGKL